MCNDCKGLRSNEAARALSNLDMISNSVAGCGAPSTQRKHINLCVVWTTAIGRSRCLFRGNSLFWTILIGLIA
jgi:hypothetical protein